MIKNMNLKPEDEKKEMMKTKMTKTKKEYAGLQKYLAVDEKVKASYEGLLSLITTDSLKTLFAARGFGPKYDVVRLYAYFAEVPSDINGLLTLLGAIMKGDLAPKNSRMRRPFMVLLSVFLAVFPSRGLTLSDKQVALVTKVFNNSYREDYLSYLLVAEGDEMVTAPLTYSKDGMARKIDVPIELAADEDVKAWAQSSWGKGDGQEVMTSNKLIAWQ